MPRNIIICIDGSSCANYAFRWAVENFLRPDDHVVLLHVSSTITASYLKATKDFKNLEPAMGEGKKEWAPDAVRAYEEKVVEQARLLTAQYMTTLGADNIKHEAVISKGDPRNIVMENIEKYQPAAVIMGSRGLGAIKRAFVGSVSDYILHNSEAPVIIVKENELKNATLYHLPDSLPTVAVIIQSATGVPQKFYARYASHMATKHASAVITYDYRGVGKSIDPKGLTKMHNVDIKTHWATRDQPAITKYIMTKFPGAETVVIGHSVGAHISPMNPLVSNISRFLFVAANSAYRGTARSNYKLSMWVFPYYVFVTTGLLGYFPASFIGLCDDLPSGVGKDWSRWSRYVEYCTIDKPIKEVYNSFKAPSYLLCFSDDKFVGREGFQGWINAFGKGRKPQMVFVDPKSDLGVDSVNHMGFFFESFKEKLWDETAPWVVRGELPQLFKSKAKL